LQNSPAGHRSSSSYGVTQRVWSMTSARRMIGELRSTSAGMDP
jgi:hypothetical protein